MKRVGALLVLSLCLIALLAAGCPASLQQQEQDLGREYAKELEQQCKIEGDKAINDRVDHIGQVLAKIANTTEIKACYGSSTLCDFHYAFKVVDDKDVNAFSLPGGYIYVNSGLVQLVQSDDELAGVLAHEVAHAAHHHLSQLIKKQNVVDRYVALITLAGILTNMRSQDLNNLLYGAQLMKTGRMSGYTMQAEKDADRTAIAYMAKSPYKPEGMLSFMKKLEAKHDANPTLPLGIYQDHPAPFRRVISIVKAMKEEGIKVDMRQAKGFAYAAPVQVNAGDDSQYKVTVGGKVIFTPANLAAGKTSKERAQSLATAVNELLDLGVTSKDVSEDPSTSRLFVKGREVLKLESADAALMGKPDRELLRQARSALEYAIWADWLCDKCLVVKQESEGESD